jgi:GT2 family glycosyltransferase
VSRPSVTVVMPFAGHADSAATAVHALRRLQTRPGDELVIVDNSGVVVAPPPVTVVRASAERSPAYARNAGAEHASTDWILFLDADCRAPSGLLDSYFESPVAADVGALAGEVVPSGDARTLAERYGAARSFLSQQAHIAHPYRPRAVAANLMVRRAAFEQVGGFYEGVRAAEDTDFSWRLQEAGWRIELRPRARVEHSYRATIGELRRQWRGYAAGRAWLARRYQGFRPEPAVRRGVRRGWRGLPPQSRHSGRVALIPAVANSPRNDGRAFGRFERGRYLALDALLAAEELRGLALSNRPVKDATGEPAQVVLVAERFPAQGDPLAEFARTLERARVEAVARPDIVARDVARELEIDYREDEGVAARAFALARLATRHPVRCAMDVLGHAQGAPRLSALAPAAVRLVHEPRARVHALGGEGVHATAQRLAALSGRRLEGRRH